MNRTFYKQENAGSGVSLSDDGLTLDFNGTHLTTVAYIPETGNRTEGKYYYEVEILDRGNAAHYLVSFLPPTFNLGSHGFWNNDGFGLYINNSFVLYRNGAFVDTLRSTSSLPAGTIFGCAIDYDNKNIKFYENGVYLTEINYTYSHIFIGHGGGNGSRGKARYAFKQRDFRHDIPAGYEAYDISGKFIFKKDEEYFAFGNGLEKIEVTDLCDAVERYGVDKLDPINNIPEKEKYEVVMLTEDETDVYITMDVKPKTSLLLADGDLSIKSVDNIDFFKVDYTQNGDADLRLIVSVDEGETWMTYDSGEWEDIKPIEQRVLESGISPGVLENIPSRKWNELRQYSDKIRFGYLINYNEDGAELTVHALNAQFDMTGVWKASIHGKDFEYEYPDNSTVKVNILTDGDYKINY